MKKIYCIGDSLAIPHHKVSYENTWIFKFQSIFRELHYISYLKRGLTTEVLTTEGGTPEGLGQFPPGSACLEYYKPDIIILQLGIVDCAPRLFKRGSIESKALSKLPKLVREIYISTIKKIRKSSEKRAYVQPKEFEYNISNYLERCHTNNVEKIIIIAIPIPDKRMIAKNSNIANSVNKYNNIYTKIAKKHSNVSIIHPLDYRLYDFEMSYDGYHPNNKGHDLIFDCLKPFFHV